MSFDFDDELADMNDALFESLGCKATHVGPGGRVTDVRVIAEIGLDVSETFGSSARSVTLIDVAKPTSADLSGGELRFSGMVFYVQRIESEDKFVVTVSANQ